ncbi:hypothetical protein BN1723_017511, partial [Verticillium longisporum]
MTSSSSPAAKLSAYLSQLNPVPTFPDYTGPYKVGTVDVEIPVSELESPSHAAESAADIYTVSCRIYYPATPDSTGKPISWLPSPQRHHVSAYTQFMERPLFTPAPDSELSKQITEKNVTMLLDMWCFPLLAPNSAPLFDLPLPAYANVPSAPGGKALLAVESDAFYKWTEHL